MKKFYVFWYDGSIDTVDTIIKQKELKAKDIESVNWQQLISDDTEIIFFRRINFDANSQVIDYGNHTKFIKIIEIGE